MATIKINPKELHSCQQLMKKYEALFRRKAICGFKFTQFFRQWINDNSFINEDLKRKLLENWDAIENQIPEIRLKELQEIVEYQGGKLHSTEYVNARTKVEVECKKGHIWKVTPNNIKNGRWCPKCAKKEKGSIEDLYELVKNHGGKLRSKIYVNAHTKVEVECKEGHIWETSPNNIKRGKWCKKCANKKNNLRRRLKLIKEIKKMAEQRGGRIRTFTSYLSAEKVNSDAKVEVVCKKGHVWKATPSNLKSGSWCPKCGDREGRFKRRLKMNKEAQIIIMLRGGKLHSTEIVDAHTKLEVECKEGHIWKVTPNNIKKGNWCAKCAHVEKGTIEELQELIRERGGKLRSTEYVNARTKVEVECKEGHIWEAIPDSIKRGTWCPECNLGRHERLCRLIFESIFDKQFQKSRPTWLLNDWENQMELDGYNQELKLAFEYQGRQHYELVPYFHKSIEELERMKANDKKKLYLCEKNGVTLIIIPYTIRSREMLDYIIKMCKEKYLNIPKNSAQIDLDQLINKSYLVEGNPESWSDLQSRIDDYFFDG
ncbi:MAG: hypothetical protein HWN65_22185 [Candidatus Helarchaeota archaeon]|nr:hypothetical protein [Candidatus Helarchaeota archaeon]